MGRGEAGVGQFVSLPNGNQPRPGQTSNAKVRQITRPLSQETPVSGGSGLGAYLGVMENRRLAGLGVRQREAFFEQLR